MQTNFPQIHAGVVYVYIYIYIYIYVSAGCAMYITVELSANSSSRVTVGNLVIVSSFLPTVEPFTFAMFLRMEGVPVEKHIREICAQIQYNGRIRIATK